jgi:hypothetical protein
MKHLLMIMALFTAKTSLAQTSDFEFPNVPPSGYWDGSDQSGGFSSGTAFFPNVYNTAFGGYWESGFTWSTVSDTVTAGFNNLYGSSSGSGNNSSGYAVVQQGAVMRIPGGNKVVQSIQINNGTYAWISMRDGDGFAKKFGGLTGNDPDFFRLLIRGYSGGVLVNDSVEFYLADYRFSNNAQDYIVRNFTTVNTAVLGAVDSLSFTLNSTDISAFGMNTPGFFVIDDVNISAPSGLKNVPVSDDVLVYPNPSAGIIFVDNLSGFEQYQIYDISGKILSTENCQNQSRLQLQFNKPGLYLLQLTGSETTIRKRLLIK